MEKLINQSKTKWKYIFAAFVSEGFLSSGQRSFCELDRLLCRSRDVKEQRTDRCVLIRRDSCLKEITSFTWHCVSESLWHSGRVLLPWHWVVVVADEPGEPWRRWSSADGTVTGGGGFTKCPHERTRGSNRVVFKKTYSFNSEVFLQLGFFIRRQCPGQCVIHQ